MKAQNGDRMTLIKIKLQWTVLLMSAAHMRMLPGVNVISEAADKVFADRTESEYQMKRKRL